MSQEAESEEVFHSGIGNVGMESSVELDITQSRMGDVTDSRRVRWYIRDGETSLNLSQ
jgi:hypothetical protein